VRQKDHYRTLGVDRTATEEEIQDAFHMLARRYHPDVNPEPEAAEHFKEISAAYDILSNPKERAKYDLETGVSSRYHTTKPYGQEPRASPSTASWQWRSQTTYNRNAEAPWYHVQQNTTNPIQNEALSALIVRIVRVIFIIPFACIVLDIIIGGIVSGLGLSSPPWFLGLLIFGAIGGFATVGWGLYLRRQTKCPRCHKAWGRETIRKENRGVFFKDAPLDGLPAIPYTRYRLHNRCRHCGHQWISTKSEHAWRSLFS
jgi:hypothetical protein